MQQVLIIKHRIKEIIASQFLDELRKAGANVPKDCKLDLKLIRRLLWEKREDDLLLRNETRIATQIVKKGNKNKLLLMLAVEWNVPQPIFKKVEMIVNKLIELEKAKNRNYFETDLLTNIVKKNQQDFQDLLNQVIYQMNVEQESLNQIYKALNSFSDIAILMEQTNHHNNQNNNKNKNEALITKPLPTMRFKRSNSTYFQENKIKKQDETSNSNINEKYMFNIKRNKDLEAFLKQSRG